MTDQDFEKALADKRKIFNRLYTAAWVSPAVICIGAILLSHKLMFEIAQANPFGAFVIYFSCGMALPIIMGFILAHVVDRLEAKTSFALLEKSLKKHDPE